MVWRCVRWCIFTLTHTRTKKKEVVKVTALKEGVNLDTSSALAAKVISVVEVAKRQSSDVYQYTRLVEHQEVRLNLSASDIINGKRLVG